MAMETEITKDGISYKNVQGTAEENKTLADSYEHLCKLRDEVISMGIIPPVEEVARPEPAPEIDAADASLLRQGPDSSESPAPVLSIRLRPCFVSGLGLEYGPQLAVARAGAASARPYRSAWSASSALVKASSCSMPGQAIIVEASGPILSAPLSVASVLAHEAVAGPDPRKAVLFGEEH